MTVIDTHTETPTHTLGGSMSNTFTLTASQFRSVASATVAASTDDVTPVIEQLQFSVDAGVLQVAATDRYRVALVTIPVETEYTGEFMVDAKAIKAFGMTAKKEVKDSYSKEVADVLFTVDDDGVTLSAGNATVFVRFYKGNYPPVVRLIEPLRANANGVGEISFDIGFLADIAKLYSPAEAWKLDKNRQFQFSFATTESGKAAPLYARNGELGNCIEYILQPRINLR